MKTPTQMERDELEKAIQREVGLCPFAGPLPELFVNLYNTDPAKIPQPGVKLHTDAVTCQCPYQPFVDWAVFASRDGRSHLLHRFRLN